MKENNNPWTTLGTETKYKNPWIQVDEHKVLTPAGKESIYGTVSARGKAVGIIPVDKNGDTWLVGQWRFPLNEYSWEIPMGACDPGEEILDTAKRELKEETGLSAKKWHKLMKIHTSNAVSDEEGHVFIATELTMGETAHEETEVLTLKKLPFHEALRMVLDEEITDSLSVSGILKAALLKLVRRDIPILFQDEHYVAVHKPAGLMVHRSEESRDYEYLLQLTRDKIGKKVYPVHRLDRPVSGVVVFGLNPESTAKLKFLIDEREVTKEYLAVVRGHTDTEGEINHEMKNRSGKANCEAITKYQRLSTIESPFPVRPYESARHSLVKVFPVTGRYHQIRRHFKHISHPLIGDTTYGDGEHNRLFREQFDCRRILLMARRFTFIHPYTKEELCVECPLDEEFQQIVSLFTLSDNIVC